MAAREPDGEVRLSDPRRPEEEHGLAVGDEAPRGELADLLFVDRRLRGEDIAGEVAYHGKAREP